MVGDVEEDGPYLVLVHSHGAHLIWPQFVIVPPGWRVVYGPDARQACRDRVDRAATAPGQRLKPR